MASLRTLPKARSNGRNEAVMHWTERVGRPLVKFAHPTPHAPRTLPRRAAGAVGSWVLWGGYRQLRHHPGLYLSGIVERSCQRLAVRWYPEAVVDPEDCEACGIAEDICVFHQGIELCASWVSKRFDMWDHGYKLNQESKTAPLPDKLREFVFPEV